MSFLAPSYRALIPTTAGLETMPCVWCYVVEAWDDGLRYFVAVAVLMALTILGLWLVGKWMGRRER